MKTHPIFLCSMLHANDVCWTAFHPEIILSSQLPANVNLLNCLHESASHAGGTLQVVGTLGAWGVGGTLLAEGLKPSTAVKFGVVADEQAIVTNSEAVDTNNRECSRGDDPSPGDGLAIVPDVQCLDRYLWLGALASIECALARKGSGAKLVDVSDEK